MVIRGCAGWLGGLVVGRWLGVPWVLSLVGLVPSAALLALVLAGQVRGRLARLAPLLGVLLCFDLGLLRAGLHQRPLPPDHIAHRNGTYVLLAGEITAEPDRRDRTTGYRLAVRAIGTSGAWSPAQGSVLVWAPAVQRHRYGESVRVSGRLEEPPVLDEFDYRAYLATRGVHSVMYRPKIETLNQAGGRPIRKALLALKGRARTALHAALPEPEASLVTGIVLGDARRIPASVDQAFRTTNTTHVIAISGSNISLLVAGLTACFGWLLGRRRCVPIILLVLVFYTALVGADPAVVRAAVMAGIMLIGRGFGRPGHTPTALCAAAWAMTAYRPGNVSDLGFQLSFAATMGLVLFTDPLERGLAAVTRDRLRGDHGDAGGRLLREAGVITVAAQLATWPLLAVHVGQVSLVGLLANLLIVPAQPPLMGLGAMTAGVGVVSPRAGLALGSAAWLPAAYTIRVVEAFAGLPYAAVSWTMPLPLAMAYYGGLLALLAGPRTLTRRAALSVDELWRWAVGLPGAIARGAPPTVDAVPRAQAREREREARERGPEPRARLATALPPQLAALTARLPARRVLSGWAVTVCLGAVAALVWVAALSRPDGLLHVYVLDVGQGDALLVVTPNGRRLLVDGGPSPSALLEQLGRQHAPWDRRLDVVLLTHPDLDHIGGLVALLGAYEVAWILDPLLESDTAEAEEWAKAAAREGAEVVPAVAGTRLILDEPAGVSAEVLWPPADTEPDAAGGALSALNNRSVVMRLTVGSTAVLLTGDLEIEGERALLQTGADVRSDVLKVAHHGSASSTSSEFLAAVRPSLAVIGVGVDNSFGHPDQAVLDRLDAIPVFRTDTDGAVDLVLDGRAVWVQWPAWRTRASGRVPLRIGPPGSASRQRREP